MKFDTGSKDLAGPGHQTVYCGYRRVSAAVKGELVRQHFDAVARKYDLMNTLLSFGLHHLWKRAAVRMMELKPGDRVLDVCGGTADLADRVGPALRGLAKGKRV